MSNYHPCLTVIGNRHPPVDIPLFEAPNLLLGLVI